MFKAAQIVDYGPEFQGLALKVDNGLVCVVPAAAEHDPSTATSMREAVEAAGGDCEECSLCPLSRAG
jgi:hypothetical protein